MLLKGADCLDCYKCSNYEVKSGNTVLKHLLKKKSNPDCADPSLVKELNIVTCPKGKVCGRIEASVKTTVKTSKYRSARWHSSGVFRN